MGLFDRGVQIKTPDQIALMREAGLVVGRTLDLLRSQVRAGITTGDLDRIAEEHIRSLGATPSFLGYQGYPGTLCVSVNDEVVHGIPGGRVLRQGDLVSIDCGAIVEGWHGDSAVTVAVGEVPEELERLLAVTEESMWRGIAAARPGGRVIDISAAVEDYVRQQQGIAIVAGYTGHGIGTEMHQAPDVPNERDRKGPRLVPGLALAVEPMLTLGTSDTRVLPDEWTAVTADGSWAAHFEHSFALTERGLWVLTSLDGGRSALERLGAPYGGD